MIENQKIRPAQVIGPLGEPLTLATLPPAGTTRWVVRRKATPNPATPSLPVLLADISARQGASRTAAIQTRLQSPTPDIVADPLVDIFAPVGQPIAVIHRFSDQIDEPVNQSKLK